jgi:hypothetical protein
MEWKTLSRDSLTNDFEVKIKLKHKNLQVITKYAADCFLNAFGTNSKILIKQRKFKQSGKKKKKEFINAI